MFIFPFEMMGLRKFMFYECCTSCDVTNEVFSVYVLSCFAEIIVIKVWVLGFRKYLFGEENGRACMFGNSLLLATVTMYLSHDMMGMMPAFYALTTVFVPGPQSKFENPFQSWPLLGSLGWRPNNCFSVASILLVSLSVTH